MANLHFIRAIQRKKAIRRVLPRPPRQPFPEGQEREYIRDLRKYAAKLQEIARERLIPRLPQLEREANRRRPSGMERADAWDDTYQAILQFLKADMSRAYSDAEIASIARRVGVSVADFTRQAAERKYQRVLGIDVFFNEPWLANQMSGFVFQNVNLIKTIDDRFYNRVTNIVASGFNAGRRWEEISEDIVASFDVSNTEADRIARDQISKLNGQLEMLRQTELGITKYTWRTSRDERVRESHREHEGETFDWDDPPAETGHPGEDINCRCYPEPVIESALEAVEAA